MRPGAGNDMVFSSYAGNIAAKGSRPEGLPARVNAIVRRILDSRLPAHLSSDFLLTRAGPVVRDCIDGIGETRAPKEVHSSLRDWRQSYSTSVLKLWSSYFSAQSVVPSDITTLEAQTFVTLLKHRFRDHNSQNQLR